MRGTSECVYAGLMKTFNFRIVPLATEVEKVRVVPLRRV